MTLPTYEEFRAKDIEGKKELLRQAKLRLIEHRFHDHGDDGIKQFYDCALCGVIENRIKNFEEELYA